MDLDAGSEADLEESAVLVGEWGRVDLVAELYAAEDFLSTEAGLQWKSCRSGLGCQFGSRCRRRCSLMGRVDFVADSEVDVGGGAVLVREWRIGRKWIWLMLMVMGSWLEEENHISHFCSPFHCGRKCYSL